jgi:ubiquinone/menaquinone biosynthesis C-methylase UbiE
MASKDTYDKAYENARGAAFNPNESLLKALDHRLIDEYALDRQGQTLDLLEAGCGDGCQYLFWKNKPLSTFIEAFDWSETGIEIAKEKAENCEIKFSIQDATSFSYPQQFDIILDSHLLHCLTETEDRSKYIKRVYDHLKLQGLFVGETMIEHKNFVLNDAVEVAYAEKVIYYKGEAQRYLASSFEIEEFLINSGFKIEFFYIPYGLRMVPIPYREKALSSDPEVVRFIARKVDPSELPQKQFNEYE